MTMATNVVAGPAAATPRPAIRAAATALAVGLLIAGTLGTAGGTIVGTAVHLLGASDHWARISASLGAASALLPAASLARRTWRVERRGEEVWALQPTSKH